MTRPLIGIQIRMLVTALLSGCSLDWSRGQHDVYGLAWAVGVVYDSACAAVQVDQAVDEFQSAALFIVCGGSPTGWSASSVVVDLGSEIVAEVGQADVDRACAMAEGVGGEFGCDEFSKLCLLAEPPCGEGLADKFASVSEFSWIIGNSPGNAGLAYQGRGHAVLLALEQSAAGADCLVVWPPALLHHSWRADLWFPFIVRLRSSSGSVHRCIDRRLSSCVNAPGNYLLQCRNRT
jgi:hypothetical protein